MFFSRAATVIRICPFKADESLARGEDEADWCEIRWVDGKLLHRERQDVANESYGWGLSTVKKPGDYPMSN
jgi:hypothetical protein